MRIGSGRPAGAASATQRPGRRGRSGQSRSGRSRRNRRPAGGTAGIVQAEIQRRFLSARGAAQRPARFAAAAALLGPSQ